MEQKEFVRMTVGLPDLNRQQQIRNIYQTAVDEINNIEVELRLLVTNEQVTALTSDLLFDLLKSKNPENWLISKYVEAKNISIPHLRTDKLKELGLFDLPDYNEILNSHASLYRCLNEAEKLNFVFPLRKLIVEYDDGDFFDLTVAFEEQLIDATTKFTQTEEQNRVLKSLESFAESLNGLHEIGVINIKKHGTTMIAPEIGLLFHVDKRADRDLVSVNPRAFQNRLLRRFYEGPLFVTVKREGFWDSE